jgi:peptidoglycan hydrolase-like protein with peptidoglycan-binding domain
VGSEKTLRLNAQGPEVKLLHALLNYHLPPPDDQLPLTGPGAMDFGPRTLEKVRKFQEVNKIDIGTKDYMDGVVGPHTWAELTKTQQLTVTISPAPPTGLQRAIERHFPVPHLTPPDVTPPSPVPGDSPAPPPKGIVLDSIQVQAGGQGTLPLRPFNWRQWTASSQVQIIGILLSREKKQNFHLEGQFGIQETENFGPGASGSRRDFSFLAVLNEANIPGFKQNSPWSWSVQEQFALIKSLSNSSGSLQLSAMPSLNFSLIKDKNDNDVLQLTGQSGLILEIDPPDGTSGWSLKAGFSAFLGLTGTFTL